MLSGSVGFALAECKEFEDVFGRFSRTRGVATVESRN